MWWKAPKPMMKWERFWRLTMLGESESRVVWQHRVTYEKCVCDCWTVKYVSRNHIRRWNIKSCWCLARDLGKEQLTKINTKHGFFWTRIYKIYQWIKIRCKYPDTPGYYRYWWRWIKCEWETFEDFYKDMWESYESHVKEYWEENTTIDRINNDGNYCKENCRRATKKEQWNNRRNNKIVVYKGKEYTQQELCDNMGVPNYVFARRMKLWWSVEDSIEKPFKRM